MTIYVLIGPSSNPSWECDYCPVVVKLGGCGSLRHKICLAIIVIRLAWAGHCSCSVSDIVARCSQSRHPPSFIPRPSVATPSAHQMGGSKPALVNLVDGACRRHGCLENGVGGGGRAGHGGRRRVGQATTGKDCRHLTGWASWWRGNG